MRLTVPGRIAYAAGFIILSFFTLTLYSFGFYESLDKAFLPALTAALWMAGFIIESVRELGASRLQGGIFFELDLKEDFLSLISVFGGSLAAYYVNTGFGLGSVTASALTGILAAVFIKPYAAAVYCGSFAGMASPEFLGSTCMIYAGIISGVVYVMCKNIFNGFGGKLGTVAFAGCIFASLITGSTLLGSAVPGWNTGIILIVYSAAGAVITFHLNVRAGYGPVLASGITGIAAGLLLPAVHGQAAGSMYALGVFSASFAGMSSKERFSSAALMVPAGIICGLIIIFTSPYMGGAGGKLGTAAFGSVIGLNGLRTAVSRLSNICKA